MVFGGFERQKTKPNKANIMVHSSSQRRGKAT
jgi:hypothetical protein